MLQMEEVIAFFFFFFRRFLGCCPCWHSMKHEIQPESLPSCQKCRFHTLINRFTQWNYLHPFHVFSFLNVISCLGKCFHMHAGLVIKSHGPLQTDPGALPGFLASLCIGSLCNTQSLQCITIRIFFFYRLFLGRVVSFPSTFFK